MSAEPVEDVIRAHIGDGAGLRVINGGRPDHADDDVDHTDAVAPELPAHLLEVPGLVGKMAKWITLTARYPQPSLSLAAALAVVGTAAGRKYAGPTKSGTHLYALAIAPTGSGKNHPAKMGKRLMRAADMSDLIGPGQFMSEPAAYETVCKRPQLLCFMDEFGSYLQRLNNPKGGGYEKAVTGVLRTLWGASFDRVDPPAWASGSNRKLEAINSPALSIFGCSVHEEFYAALQSNDIANGFLNRFLIFSTNNDPEETEPELDEDVIPPAIVEWLQRVGSTSYDPSRVRTFNSAVDPMQPDVLKADIQLDWETAEARLLWQTFAKDLKAKASGTKLLSRVAEQAVRLATIRAIGRVSNPNMRPAINLEDITWACELALWSGERMVADVQSYMVESIHQGKLKEVLRYIQQAPRCTITLSDLYRKIKHKYDSTELRRIIDSLEEGETVETWSDTAEGAKRRTKYIKFMGNK